MVTRFDHTQPKRRCCRRRAGREIWKLTKGTRVAICTLWNHPIGAELRCDVDDEMQQTKASRTVGELLDVAHEWRKAFEAKGWTA